MPRADGQEDGTPVEHGALGQEDDEAEDADEEHDAVRNGEDGALASRAVGQEVRRGQREQDENGGAHAQRRGKRRRSGAQQRGDAGGTGDAAKTELAVEAGHHRPPAGTFDDDRLDVDCHVEGADTGAEHEHSAKQQGQAGDRRQHGQGEAEQHRRHGDDETAAETCREGTGERHRHDRADAEAEQDEPEHAVIDRGTRLGERHERSPGRHDEAGDEERNARG